MHLSEIDIEKYLSKFKVIFPDTLFPPDFSALKEKRCPLCGNKIYETKNKKGWLCKSKTKHKRFYITSEVFNKFLEPRY